MATEKVWSRYILLLDFFTKKVLRNYLAYNIIVNDDKHIVYEVKYMLVTTQQPEFSYYAGIYDCLIPKDHFLRKFNDLIDFSFVYDELKDKYCLDNGRNAVSSILLFKYFLLKALYNLSDADLIERSRYDMSFKYFLGLRPEDEVIHSTTLTKFRKLRLSDENLLDMLITKSVQIGIEKGVVKSNHL